MLHEIRSPCFLALSLLLSACGETDGATMDGATDTGGTETDGGLFETEPEIVRYDTQPMIVDLHVSVADGATLDIEHLDDPGVLIRPLEQGVHRIRGLRPETSHELQLRAERSDTEETRSVTFDTLPPLPGFPQGFAIESSGQQSEQLYRLFDLNRFGDGGAVGIAMIDTNGVTRWYLGEQQIAIDPLSVWSGVKLRPDGTVLYARSDSAVIKNELGQDVMRVAAEDVGYPIGFHHDVIELPNGNFMALSVEFRQIEYEDQGTLSVYGDVLVEFDREGNVAWTWNAFEHLDPQRRRQGFNEGFPLQDPETGEIGKDWTHGNGMIYRAEDDSILLSLRHQDWILKLDHATGDVVWRLGDEGDFTLEEGTWFFHQHSPQWQPDGSLLLYDNAVGNPDIPDEEAHSRAVIYSLDESTMTARQIWQDDAEPFVSTIMGDADRLPGGNYLVLDSSLGFEDGFDVVQARLRELDPDASPMEIWSLQTLPGQFIYRANAWDRLVGLPAE